MAYSARKSYAAKCRPLLLRLNSLSCYRALYFAAQRSSLAKIWGNNRFRYLIDCDPDNTAPGSIPPTLAMHRDARVGRN
jgi:hypothetical protein